MRLAATAEDADTGDFSDFDKLHSDTSDQKGYSSNEESATLPAPYESWSASSSTPWYEESTSEDQQETIV